MQLNRGGLLGVLAIVALAVAGFAVERAEATAKMLTGACCQPNGLCVEITEFDCTALGGIYSGDLVPCGEAPCDARVDAPVLSMLGLVGLAGALSSLALFRLIRRRSPPHPS